MANGSREGAGFTLIEVLIAGALLGAIAIGVAHLFGVSTAAGRSAREQTATTLLAASKLEQLRSLAWSYEPTSDGNPIFRSDESTDLSKEPAAAGGPGIAASPPGTLQANVPPHVDYLDGQGRWVGTGSFPPSSAVYIRRWSVRPLPEDPARTIILSVLVTTVAQDGARTSAWSARSGSEALLIMLNTRKGRS